MNSYSFEQGERETRAKFVCNIRVMEFNQQYCGGCLNILLLQLINVIFP